MFLAVYKKLLKDSKLCRSGYQIAKCHGHAQTLHSSAGFGKENKTKQLIGLGLNGLSPKIAPSLVFF